MRTLIKHLVLLFAASVPLLSLCQTATLQGIVVDASTLQPVEAALVYIDKTREAVYTDSAGTFELLLAEGIRGRLVVTHLSYLNDTTSLSDDLYDGEYISISIERRSQALDEVRVVANPFERNIEAPTSLRRITTEQILRNPGSGDDIGRIMQILPGVATTSSFRNDLIIRGGSPSENAFYIDDFRVPTINHLTTQGASGGSISLLNVDFIREADLVSGNFGAQYGNAVSSAFNFQMIEGSSDKYMFRVSAGATNAAIAAQGPIGDNATFIASIRRSYRQYILRILGLAIYPVYNDFTAKVTYRPSSEHELTFLALGAADKFRLNADIRNSEIQEYLLESLPVSDQWNYTVGAKHKYFAGDGWLQTTVSRSHLYNDAQRQVETAGSTETTLEYDSEEIRHFINSQYVLVKPWGRFRAGMDLQANTARFDVFNFIFTQNGPQLANFESDISYWMYGAFAQLSASILPDKWEFTAGLRIDGSDYGPGTRNPIDQLSPRLSTSLQVSEQLRISAGVGRYFQMPGDVTLGFMINDSLVNRDATEYFSNTQVTLGVEYLLPWNARLTLEAYHKTYRHYPFDVRDSLSLANQGDDFGVFGNAPIAPTGSGRARGIELMYEQKLNRGWFGTLSYTFGESAFDDKTGNYVSSSWDARHIVNLALSRQFKHNWQAGINLRYQSARPFTPFDMFTSSFTTVWDINQQGIRDFTQLNTLRGKSNLFIDLRIDKRWDMKWGSYTFFMDLENILFDADSQQVLVLDKTDANGNPTEDAVIVNPDDPAGEQRYKLKEIRNAEGVLIPTFGFILDF